MWRVVDNKGCPEQCDACRRDNHECMYRWIVIETDGYVEGESLLVNGDCLIAAGFESREEAEAYILHPEEIKPRFDDFSDLFDDEGEAPR